MKNNPGGLSVETHLIIGQIAPLYSEDFHEPPEVGGMRRQATARRQRTALLCSAVEINQKL
jgi:hypothetical protein